MFQELDRPALGPLPQDRFELQQWATARVNIDYHVEIDFHYYSVPYVLTGQVVEMGLENCASPRRRRSTRAILAIVPVRRHGG